MPEPETLAAIRAAVEVLIPPTDGMPGAADLGVQDHVVALIEQGLQGMTDMAAALLNAYAAEVKPGAAFAELSIEERSAVLRAISLEPSQDIREAVDGLILFTNGGMYSEWTGYDKTTRELHAPASWSKVGYHGPVHGHPEYRVGI